MIDIQEQTIQARSGPSSWFLRWAAYCVAGTGYLFGLFLVQRTLPGFLLLTAIYGVWLLVYHVGRPSEPLFWLLGLSFLACASLFIPLPSTNAYWLPILPTMTACLVITRRPWSFGLGVAALLWLSTGLAFSLITRELDIGGQIILLISFASTCGCTATISELIATHAQLQRYSVQVEELSIVRERNRIAREIHDTLGHSLTLLSVQLETATQLEMRADARLHEELLQARQVVKACLLEVRQSVEALRPAEGSGDSLQEQLRRLVAEFEATSSQTRITLDLEEEAQLLRPEVCFTLYRCAQEALTNIRKHAHATKVLLRLSTSGERMGQVELTVLDNGQAVASLPAQPTSGFGLRGMSERVALLNGTLRAGPEPEHGWRVEVVLPQRLPGKGHMERRAARTKKALKKIWKKV